MIRTSPTQISLLRECERKYAFKYVKGIRQPTTPAMQFGLEGHDLLEQWLRHGDYPPDTDVGLTARQGIRDGWLPTPHDSLMVEIGMILRLPDLGANIIGLADCIVPPSSEIPIVIDHKFTSALKWAKKAAELRNDPQSLFYTRWVREYFEVLKSKARWIYYAGTKPKGGERPRKPAGAQKVELILAHNDKTWDAMRADIARIVELRATKPDPKSLKATTSSCDNYGGCPYKRVCMKQPGRFFPSHKQTPPGEKEKVTTIMGLADKMAGSKTAGASTVNPPKGDDLEQKLKDALNDEVGTEETAKPPAKSKKAAAAKKPAASKKKNGNGKESKVLIVLQGALPNVHAPILGETVQLVDILAPLMREVANENGVGHWNLVEYSQGKALLAAKLDVLWGEKRPNGTIIADFSAEAQAVQSVLTGYADVVIHGVR